MVPKVFRPTRLSHYPTPKALLSPWQTQQPLPSGCAAFPALACHYFRFWRVLRYAPQPPSCMSACPPFCVGQEGSLEVAQQSQRCVVPYHNPSRYHPYRYSPLSAVHTLAPPPQTSGQVRSVQARFHAALQPGARARTSTPEARQLHPADHRAHHRARPGPQPRAGRGPPRRLWIRPRSRGARSRPHAVRPRAVQPGAVQPGARAAKQQGPAEGLAATVGRQLVTTVGCVDRRKVVAAGREGLSYATVRSCAVRMRMAVEGSCCRSTHWRHTLVCSSAVSIGTCEAVLVAPCIANDRVLEAEGAWGGWSAPWLAGKQPRIDVTCVY